MRRWMVVGALLVGALAIQAPGFGAGAPVLIGVTVPLSGSNAEAGQDVLNGANLAVAAGGGSVLGRPIQIVSADDACDAQQGVTAAQKLVDAGVVAVAGGYCSSAAIPASGVYHTAGVAFVADASTNPQLTEQGFNNVFRDIGRDDLQGPFAAGFMLNTLHAHKIAIIHDNTVYAKGLAQATQAALQGKPGVSVVFFDAITPGDKDFTAVLTKIKGLGPDATYFTGYYAEGGLIAKQFKDVGVPGQFVAGDANNDDVFIKEAGAAANGVMITTAPIAQFLPGAKAYIAAYNAKYGKAPGAYSAYEYDAIGIVIDAIKRANSTDRAAIVKAIAQTKDYKGITGSITLNAKGDRAGTVYIVLQIKNGQFTAYSGM